MSVEDQVEPLDNTYLLNGLESVAIPIAFAAGINARARSPATTVTYLGELYVCINAHRTTSTFDPSKWLKIVSRGNEAFAAGYLGLVNIEWFRDAGDDSDMFNAAVQYCLTNNTGPLFIPNGIYNPGSKGWYLNDGGSPTGAPIDGFHIIMGGVGSPQDIASPDPEIGVYINGVVHIGCGFQYVDAAGQSLCDKTTFISRHICVEGGALITGCMNVVALQYNSYIGPLKIKPAVVSDYNVHPRLVGTYTTYDGGNDAGIFSCFTNVTTFDRISVDFGLTLNGWEFDSCSNIFFQNVSARGNLRGYNVSKRFNYDPSIQTSGLMSRQCSNFNGLGGMHAEANIEEDYYLANMNTMYADLRCNPGSATDFSVPRIQLGHASDSSQSSILIVLFGHVAGNATAASTTDSIGVSIGYCTRAATAGIRISNYQIAVDQTANALDVELTNLNPGSGVLKSVRIPAGTTSATRKYSGHLWQAPNAGPLSEAIAALFLGETGPTFELRTFNSSPSATSYVTKSAGGTPDAPVPVTSGPFTAGNFESRVLSNTGVYSPVAAIKMGVLTATPSPTNTQGRMNFWVTPESSTALANIGTLDWTRGLLMQCGIAPISVAVADLPATPTVGMMVAVNDGAGGLAWGATVTGGGSTPYLVWWNGSNWTVMGK